MWENDRITSNSTVCGMFSTTKPGVAVEGQARKIGARVLVL